MEASGLLSWGGASAVAAVAVARWRPNVGRTRVRREAIDLDLVHESLLRLVGRPPAGLRFVATTRRDPPWPLDRLRLAGVINKLLSFLEG